MAISLGQLAEASGKATHLLSLLTDGNALQKWIDDVDRGIQLVSGNGAAAQDVPTPAPVAEKLLEFVTSANLDALPRFVAADNFKEDITGTVRIWSLGGNFKAKFLQRTEDATEPATINIRKLLKRSRDPAIRSELGSGHEMPLGQFFYLLAKQGNGEEAGSLLVNGWANVAYIPDDDGIVWAVYAYWYAGNGGWNVEVYSVEDPVGWLDGCRILSR